MNEPPKNTIQSVVEIFEVVAKYLGTRICELESRDRQASYYRFELRCAISARQAVASLGAFLDYLSAANGKAPELTWLKSITARALCLYSANESSVGDSETRLVILRRDAKKLFAEIKTLFNEHSNLTYQTACLLESATIERDQRLSEYYKEVFQRFAPKEELSEKAQPEEASSPELLGKDIKDPIALIDSLLSGSHAFPFNRPVQYRDSSTSDSATELVAEVDRLLADTNSSILAADDLNKQAVSMMSSWPTARTYEQRAVGVQLERIINELLEGKEKLQQLHWRFKIYRYAFGGGPHVVALVLNHLLKCVGIELEELLLHGGAIIIDQEIVHPRLHDVEESRRRTLLTASARIASLFYLPLYAVQCTYMQLLGEFWKAEISQMKEKPVEDPWLEAAIMEIYRRIRSSR